MDSNLDPFKIKVSSDSRTIKKGEYFIPVVGEYFDGHKFIDDAISKGAKGVLTEIELHNLVRKKLTVIKPRIIGITGSLGKTTTKDAVSTVIKKKFNTYSSTENRNTLLSLSIDIINNLDKEAEFLVLEMGMDRLNEIAEICSVIHPNISVITNIYNNHLEKLKSMKNIINTKAGILDCLESDEICLVNYDNRNSKSLTERGNCVKLLFSMNDSDADYYVTDIIEKNNHIKFTVNGADKVIKDIQLNVIGEHYIYAALISVIIGLLSEIPQKLIKSAVLDIKGSKGRQNIIQGKNGSTVIDDSYNASVESVNKLLDVIKKMSYKRNILFLGDMLELGSDEQLSHELILNKVLNFGFDKIILVGDRLKHALDSKQINNISTFNKSDEITSEFIENLQLDKNSLIGIKGSRGIEMEKILKILS